MKKLKFLPQDKYVKFYYEYYSGRKLDYNNPIDFNDKLSWYKVFYRKPILNQLVDKYAVRSYVKDKIGEEYLNDLIAVYDKASEVNFEKLPEKFVIKGTHGFHFNLIVKDKSTLNKSKAKFLFIKWLSKNQYYRGGMEWAYKNVKPRLIAEKFLEEEGKSVLNDYKFFCFEGKPKFVQVDIERGNGDYRCYYDLEWNKMDLITEVNNFYKGEIEKPENFEEMLLLSEKLADDFPFVRVDLYSVNGKTIFGEMTFYPTDARKRFIPEEMNITIGNYFVLPKIPKDQKYIK